MSHLIGQIEQHCNDSGTKKGVSVYYYCYFGHDQDEAAPLLRWLLFRLCREANVVPSSLYKLFKHGGAPDITDLLGALEDVVTSFDIIYVAVDAVDESKHRGNLLKVLRDLGTDSRFDKIHLIVSGREYLDIEKAMEALSTSLSMSNEFVDEDIRTHIRARLHSHNDFRHWPQDILPEVEDALVKGAKGM